VQTRLSRLIGFVNVGWAVVEDYEIRFVRGALEFQGELDDLLSVDPGFSP